jgi:hypothetical protein
MKKIHIWTNQDGDFSMAGPGSQPKSRRSVPVTEDPKAIAAGFRAVFRMFDTWELGTDERMTLLGRPSRSTFYKWKSGEVGSVSYDTVRRLSYLLGIYKALQILYQDRALADGWIKHPNLAFAGKSALDRMMGGDVADLAAVRGYLDAVRGGWS